jgi:Zn-dependent protease
MFGSGYKLRIGVIAGHEVYLDLIGFGLFALFVITGVDPGGSLRGPVAFLVAAFIAVLVHELGHALAVHRLTGQHAAIVIGFFGGYTLYMGTERPRAKLIISLAGPFAGFVLGAAGWILALALDTGHAGWPPWAFAAGDSIWLLTLQIIVLASFYWGLLNLVPAYPLDGGQALRALLSLFGMAPGRARMITRRLAVGIVIAVAIWVLKTHQSSFLLFIGVWIFFANADEARQEGW